MKSLKKLIAVAFFCSLFLIAQIHLLYAQNTVNANNDFSSTFLNSTVIIDVLANDIGNIDSVFITQNPENGAVTVLPNKTISYTPQAGFVGTDTLSYAAVNLQNGTGDIAEVVIQVSEIINSPIFATADTAFTTENNSVVISVLLNDIGNGIYLNANSLTAPANGSVIANPDGTVTYTPDLNFVGADVFQYGILDANGNSTIGQVVVQVQGNLPPNSDTLYACTNPMTPKVICHTYTDPNGDAVVINPQGSSTTFNCSLAFLNDSCFRYTPLPAFTGTDTVHLKICEKNNPAVCTFSYIIVSVGCSQPVAQPDFVVIDNSSLNVNGAVINTNSAHDNAIINATQNDFDACGSALGVSSIVKAPKNGTAIVVAGKVVYDANLNYVGTDTLSYTTCNSCLKCDTTKIVFQILPDIANCNKDTTICIPPFTTLPLCPAFCSNVINPVISGTAQKGSISPTANGCYNYVSPNLFETLDVVTFLSCSNGVCDTTKYTISINADCGTNAPVAQNDAASILVTETALIPVLSNDVEPDGGLLTITQVQTPDCGTAQILGNAILYTPTANCSGNIVFDYVVCDNTQRCDTATISVNIHEQCDLDTLTYCTPSYLTPVTICGDFCGLGEGAIIKEAETTFHCSIAFLNDSCIRYTPLPGFVGTDLVWIVACDNNNVCDTIYANVKVGCLQPVATNDEGTVPNDEILVIDVLANDYDLCGSATLTSTPISNPENGTIVHNTDGTFSYSPNANYVGDDQFLYVTCKDCPLNVKKCDTATVFITVTLPTNFVPLHAQPDIEQTPFETAITFNVLYNDEGSTLTLTSTTLPQNGTVLTNTNGTITYNPNPGFAGSDYFFYTVCNQQQTCETVLVNVTVLPQNNNNLPPIAQNDVATTNVGVPINVAVTDNDNDPENQPLSITNILQPPTNGTATIVGTFVNYAPNANFTGTDIFTYIICDSQQLCDTATVAVFVGTIPTNQPPVAQNDEITTNNGAPVSIDVLQNDVDPNTNDVLTTELVTQPMHGTVTQTQNGVVEYTPEANYNGFDYFMYIVCDNGTPSLCDTAHVEVGVGNTNIAPIANPKEDTTFVNTPINFDINEMVSDADHSDTQLTSSILITPINGVVSIVNGKFEYTPTNNFVGIDSFMYKICDPVGACDSAFVVITVLEKINAQPNAFFTQEATPITFNVIYNDEGTNIVVTGINIPPKSGILENIDSQTGEVTYLPNAGFVGVDYFSYIICDNFNMCDTTLVSITVLPANAANQAPIAQNDVAFTPQNTPVQVPILSNDTDPNNNPLTASITQNPANGTVTLNPDGTVTYTPNENVNIICDVFQYAVCDNGTPQLCDTAWVAVGIGTSSCLNNPPIAQNDNVTTPENTPVSIVVMINDTDPDNQPISVNLVSLPANGNITTIQNNVVNYTPNPNFVGIDYFMYAICDNANPQLCDTAYVTVTVIPQGVQANPDLDYTNINTPVSISVISNDLGTNIEITAIVTSPDFGDIEIVPGTGVITYVPEQDFVGTDYFEYQICGANDDCDVTVVTVVVLPAEVTNIQPNAVNDYAETPQNTNISIPVLQNDNDPFGGNQINIDPNSITDPANGTVSFNANTNEILYVPNPNFTGIDSFTYTICDNGIPSLCDTATVIVDVNQTLPPNNGVVAIDDIAFTDINTPIEISILNNDFDPEGNAFNITFISTPAHGQVSQNPNNTATYTPNTDYTGTDYFTYIICDNGMPSLCDTAYVTIAVAAIEAEINVTTPENIAITVCPEQYLSDGFEIDTIMVTQLSEYGSIIINGIQEDCIQYIPNLNYNGSDVLIIQVCDSSHNCIPVTINIEVTPKLDPPVAQNDTVSTLPNTPVTIGVLGNDTDPDNDLVPVAIVYTNPINGTTQSTPFGDSIIYTPNPNFMGKDSFQYVIFDETGLSDTAWVIITINNLIPIPENSVVAISDFDTTQQNQPININILQNDIIQPEAVLNSVTILNAPANGTATLNPANEVIYTPNADFVGKDSLQYIVCVNIPDQIEPICDTAFVNITVLPAPPNNNCTLEFANIFSPNNDNKNDTWLITGVEENCYQTAQIGLNIFNRWGDLVYQNDQYRNDKAWNGGFNNSSNPVPDGTYFYVLSIKNNTQNNQQHSGYIEVRR